MGTNFHLLILTLSSLLYTCISTTSSVIGLSSKPTKYDYLYTTISWGTPPQSFKVLIDTTDHTSWIYNASVNTKQSKFNSGKSSTFEPTNITRKFIYQTENTEIKMAKETLIIDNKNYAINTTSFATAIQNFSITDTEGVSGFLCLDRQTDIIQQLYNNNHIKNQSVSIDIANNNIYFGEYIPSHINNLSNATGLSITSNTELNKIWTFDIDVYINTQQAVGNNIVRGVIDSASPYITIYANTTHYFETFWRLLDGSHTGESFNCNYTTRICSDISKVMSSMTIVINDPQTGKQQWNISFFKDDIIFDKKYIQFFYDNDTDYAWNGDTDYVLFLGKPFLDQLLVTMDYNAETVTFYSLKQTTSSLNWITIVIVFASVVAFALIFFGIYYWKFGKIPPPSNDDVEEQSLLRGPVQAVGSSQGQGQAQGQGQGGPGGGGPVGASGNGNVQGVSSGWSGISGLDDDNDEELQRQIQQAQRLSAIEAQQKREQQMREEQIRQSQIQMDEQKQQEQIAKEENKKQQKIGGQGQKPQDANELRQRRLKFLEEQQKKAMDNDQ